MVKHCGPLQWRQLWGGLATSDILHALYSMIDWCEKGQLKDAELTICTFGSPQMESRVPGRGCDSTSEMANYHCAPLCAELDKGMGSTLQTPRAMPLAFHKDMRSQIRMFALCEPLTCSGPTNYITWDPETCNVRSWRATLSNADSVLKTLG